MARTGRGRRSMLALGLALTCLAVPAGAAPAGCAVEGAFINSPDGWTRIAAPLFGAGGETLTAYAVDELRPDRLYATNGVGIAASRDGGCTWTESELPRDELDGVPRPGAEGGLAQRRVLDVQLPFAAASTVWALGITDVVAAGSPVNEPRVLLSVDGGRTFALRSTDLPRLARPVELRAGASPLEAFVLLDEAVPTRTRALWSTVNGGTTWVRAGEADFEDFAVDPFRRVLWAWNSSGLYASSDGGASWSNLRIAGVPRRVDVSPAFTTVVLDDGVRLDLLGAGRGVRAPAPALVTSVAAGPEFGLVATSSTVDGVTVDPPVRSTAAPASYTPDDATLSDLAFAQTKTDAGYVLYGLSPRALYRRAISSDFPVDTRPPVSVTLRPPTLPPLPKPALQPPAGLVTLKPGEVRRMRYDLVVPPAPTPLDVFFMTDSTGSMRDAIASVQEGVQGIVDDLTVAGIDLHFGVADFRDYPSEPTDRATYPYKRRRPTGPVNDELGQALEEISTGGGQGDDSALEAIYQAVTGDGRNGLTASIPAGEGAEFRRDALKVVLVASDEEMREPKLTEPWNAGPTKQAVIDALVRNDVEIVGIKVDSGRNGGDPRPQMEELARAAGSLAPPAGVDCDGDGTADLYEGEPLVCDFQYGGGSIAAAFVNMLRGIKDFADVHVGVAGPRDVVRHLGEETFEGVNVKVQNSFAVPVEYRCTPARYGTDTPVTIEGVLRSRTIAAGTATVRCLAPAKAPVVVPPVPPRQPPRPLRAAAVPPPPPPQPNPNVNPNPNPNPQTQANTGMAAQEDQQHQLAVADNDIGDDEELAFSALSPREDVTPAVTLLVGALVACAAAGVQLHLARRTRTATSRVPNRSPSRGARR